MFPGSFRAPPVIETCASGQSDQDHEGADSNQSFRFCVHTCESNLLVRKVISSKSAAVVGIDPRRIARILIILPAEFASDFF